MSALVKLSDCPPGLFMFGGILGFKTEYGATIGSRVTHWPDAYCVESGEFFWGGAKSHEVRADLLVLPIECDLSFARVLIGQMREALRPFAGCVEFIGASEDDDEWAKFRLIIKDYRAAKAAFDAAGEVLS